VKNLTDLPPQNLELERTILHCINPAPRAACLLPGQSWSPSTSTTCGTSALFTVPGDPRAEGALDGHIIGTDLLEGRGAGPAPAAVRGRGVRCYDILGSVPILGSPYNGRIYIRDLRELAKMRRTGQIGNAWPPGRCSKRSARRWWRELGRPAWTARGRGQHRRLRGLRGGLGVRRPPRRWPGAAGVRRAWTRLRSGSNLHLKTACARAS